MREIKFRAWDKIKDNMFVPTTLSFDEKCPSAFTKDHTRLDIGLDCILMQYTGLQDKNGKEIYEGDIIQWGDNDGLIQEVVWNNKGFWSTCEKDICADFPSITIPENCKIIGNLYENPELLTPNPVVTGE